MATGRSMQLTKQVGEYLASAELCRRGLISTTFTGHLAAGGPGGVRQSPAQTRSHSSGNGSIMRLVVEL